MIGQLKILLRVKQLKESRALRAMQKKRQEVADALLLVEEKRAVVAESARTIEPRQDAIYREIIGEVVDLGRIDDTKGRVLRVETEHQKLVDELERARHVHARLEKELEEATLAYRRTLKDREKYDILTESVAAEIALEQGVAEENEIEDLFSRKRKAVA
jgi:hypothetical protein